jgi:flagellar biosynthesis protein
MIPASTGGVLVAEDEQKRKPGKPKQPIAVALAYEPERTQDAPRVTATGRGKLAERIVQLAFKSGVKVREDADLAEVLAAVEVDTMIPLEAFMAVAEILAYVYKANRVDPPSVSAP